MRLRVVLVLVAALLAYPAWLAVQIYQQSNVDETRGADAIVVMGAAQYDGDPSPVFKARLDQAAYLYTEDLSDTVIVTGGKREGDRFTEAEAGSSYLKDKEVPDDAIIEEPEGTSTLESLENVQRIATSEGIRSLLLVSDPLHAERLKRIAEDLGFQEAFASWASYASLERSRATKAKEILREVAAILAYELFDR